MKLVIWTAWLIIVMLAVDLNAASLGAPPASGPDWLTYIGLAVFGATLANNVLTLADWAKRLDPDGKVPTIVELLAQTNPILRDMNFKEGNLPTGHQSAVRTGLPTVYWRMINQGIPPSKSQVAQVTDQAGMLEAWSEVDSDLMKLNGNSASFRLSEAQGFIEAMNIEAAQTIFYGNSGLAPEEFTGLAPRYSSLSSTVANYKNVVSAGGSGSDNTSVWLIIWGDNTVFGIFPKGSKAGLQHDDYNEVTVEVSAGVGGNRMRAFQERYQWKLGLVVKDWRYAVRIANIDVSDLAGGTPPDLLKFMTLAAHRIPAMGMGRAVWYMNRTVSQWLDIQERNAVSTGGGLSYENVDGRRIMSFRGIPIEVTDAILDTEAAVS